MVGRCERKTHSNIRELRNVMERALILSGGETILPLHLPKEIAMAEKGSAPCGNDKTLPLGPGS